jgi:anti-sigma regulatory factor (Ser/Thr protein kinase)
MSNDAAHTELILHEDTRFFGAIAAVVQHASQRCGLSEAGQQGLTSAVEEACRETFPLMEGQANREPTVRVIVSDYPDRVEVAIEHTGEALPTAGLDTFIGDAAADPGAGLSRALQMTKVDRVQYATSGGLSRMTLIKYCDGGRKAQA